MSDDADRWIYYGWIACVSAMAIWFVVASDLWAHAATIWTISTLLVGIRLWSDRH